jgi:predicted nucleotidyltransferase
VDLEGALAIEDETERMLGVVGVITEAVRDLGVRPVVVGGLAVQYWTQARYTTSDIDLLLPGRPEIDERLQALGLERRGRHWVLSGSELFIEAPGSALGPSERIEEVDLSDGTAVALLSLEDVLIYRLHEFVATGHADVAEQAAALVSVPNVNQERLRQRASEERLTNAVEAIERLARRSEAGERFETWELHEIARELRRPTLNR